MTSCRDEARFFLVNVRFSVMLETNHMRTSIVFFLRRKAVRQRLQNHTIFFF